MEYEQINVNILMEELKEKAMRRTCANEAADFDMILRTRDDGERPFVLDDFKEELQDAYQNGNIEYDIPLEGKGKLIKKIIRKLYRFHMKPLWDRQNDVNGELFLLINHMKNFICYTEKENQKRENRIEALEKMCIQYEIRLKEMGTSQKGDRG